jgi:hypothetical protein
MEEAIQGAKQRCRRPRVSSIEAPNGDRWSLIRDDGEVRSCMNRTPLQAAGRENLHVMLDGIGFAMMEATIQHARRRAEVLGDEAPV